MAVVGEGVDCIHLVVEILSDAGVMPRFRFPSYNVADGLHERSDRMRDGFLRCAFAREVDKKDPQFGDVAIGKTGRFSGHCAFMLDGQIVHALARQFVVVSPWRLWRREMDTLIRIEQPGLREQPSQLWRNSLD